MTKLRQISPGLRQSVSSVRAVSMLAIITVLCLLAGSSVLAGTIYPCGEELEILRHATSCSKFIICMHGQAIERSCREGFYFDPNVAQCKPAANVNCTLGTDPCPPFDDPNNLIFHPHEDFCNHFFLCYNGEKVELSCATGLYWDREREFCTMPAEADCPTSITCPPIPGITYEPHPKRCESYFICISGVLIDVSTCTYPMIFDFNERNCNTPDIAQCVRDPCIGTDGHITIPNPENCQEMVFCQNGRLISTQMCPDGQIAHPAGGCADGDPETCELFNPPTGPTGIPQIIR